MFLDFTHYFSVKYEWDLMVETSVVMVVDCYCEK